MHVTLFSPVPVTTVNSVPPPFLYFSFDLFTFIELFSSKRKKDLFYFFRNFFSMNFPVEIFRIRLHFILLNLPVSISFPCIFFIHLFRRATYRLLLFREGFYILQFCPLFISNSLVLNCFFFPV